VSFDPQSAPKAAPTPRIISAAIHSRFWRRTGAMLDAERGQYSEPKHSSTSLHGRFRSLTDLERCVRRQTGDVFVAGARAGLATTNDAIAAFHRGAPVLDFTALQPSAKRQTPFCARLLICNWGRSSAPGSCPGNTHVGVCDRMAQESAK
jgi:hypothetical protein